MADLVPYRHRFPIGIIQHAIWLYHRAHLVDGATDDAPEAGAQKRAWDVHKMAYLAKLPQEEASALLVSASDKLHNARAIRLLTLQSRL